MCNINHNTICNMIGAHCPMHSLSFKLNRLLHIHEAPFKCTYAMCSVSIFFFFKYALRVVNQSFARMEFTFCFAFIICQVTEYVKQTQITLYTSPYVPEPIFWISSYSSCGLRRDISELSKSELCADGAAAMPLVKCWLRQCF